MVVGQAQANLDDAAQARRAIDEARRRPLESGASFSYRLNRAKLKKVRRREVRYLLRTNLSEQDPVKLWEYYLQLVAVKEAFKNLRSRYQADQSPARGAHRGAHFHHLSRLLAACHSRLPTESSGAGAYASFRARQVCRRADD
jgi:hypothetical protein